jgi:hypothetical protein
MIGYKCMIPGGEMIGSHVVITQNIMNVGGQVQFATVQVPFADSMWRYLQVQLEGI